MDTRTDITTLPCFSFELCKQTVQGQPLVLSQIRTLCSFNEQEGMNKYKVQRTRYLYQMHVPKPYVERSNQLFYLAHGLFCQYATTAFLGLLFRGRSSMTELQTTAKPSPLAFPNTFVIFRTQLFLYSVNPLKPNDPYMGRTAPLTSKRGILYIYSTNIGTEYFKHGIYSPFFFLFKMQFVS